MTKQNNNQRLSLEYSQFNSDIELQESRDKRYDRKKSSFLQTLSLCWTIDAEVQPNPR